MAKRICRAAGKRALACNGNIDDNPDDRDIYDQAFFDMRDKGFFLWVASGGR